MTIHQFHVGPLETNCFLAVCDATNHAVIIDPGGVSEQLIDAVKKTTLDAILLTHGHFDHILGVKAIADMTGAPVMIHESDAHMLGDTDKNGSYMIGTAVTAPEANRLLKENDEITFGDSSLKVIHTPGHTEGGISFVAGESDIICGDTLFRMSIGRWDLPGGDYNTLIETLHSKFFPLPDDMKVYPGHGESTTIGFEKAHNQFMQDNQ